MNIFKRFKKSPDVNELDEKATALADIGALDEAMKLFQDEERICREQGDNQRVETSIINQARILDARNDVDGVISVYKKMENFCREVNDKGALSVALMNQAKYMNLRSPNKDALALADEAYRLAEECGQLGLPEALDEIRTKIIDHWK
jgi:hypothetical protein